MRRQIATTLREIAETMPTVFDMQDDWVMWSGRDLLLTPMADKVDDKDALYKVWCPKLVAVDHRHQLKDAFKRGGWDEVKAYQIKVLKMCGLTDTDVNNLITEKKQELYN